MNYYQLPIIKPSSKTILELFNKTSHELKIRGLNICIAHKQLYDLYCELSRLPILGQNSQCIFNYVVEIAVNNILNDLKHISKPSHHTILIRSGLKAKNKL